MNRRTILQVLAVLLAFVAAYALTTAFSRKGATEIFAGLDLTAEQSEEIAAEKSGFCTRFRTSHGAIAARRARLVELVRAPAPDRKEIDACLDEIAALQATQEKETVDYLMRVCDHLDERQRGIFLERVSGCLNGLCEAQSRRVESSGSLCDDPSPCDSCD